MGHTIQLICESQTSGELPSAFCEAEPDISSEEVRQVNNGEYWTRTVWIP